MQVSISFAGIFFLTLIFLGLGVGVIKLLSLIGNAVVGRRSEAVVPVQRPRSSSRFPYLMVFGIIAGVSLMLYRTRIDVHERPALAIHLEPASLEQLDHSVVLSDALNTAQQDIADANSEVHADLREAMADIEEARREIHEAITGKPATPADVLPAADEPKTTSADTTVADTTVADTTVAGENQDFVILKISPAALAELVGERRTELLKALRDKLPDGHKHTFALIQLSAPGSETAAPGMTPLVVAEKLTNLAVSVADMVSEEESATANAESAIAEPVAAQPTQDEPATAVQSVAEPPAPDSPATPTAPTLETAKVEDGTRPPQDVAAVSESPAPQETAAAQPALESQPAPASQPSDASQESVASPVAESATQGPPAWLKTTPPNQLVVKTAFFPEGESGDNELKDIIRTSLQKELTAIDRTYLRPEFVPYLVSIRVDDRAVQACVSETYEEHEPVETSDGTLNMKRIHALISIPDNVREDAVQQVRNAVQMNRVEVVLLSLAMVWMAIVIGAVCVRSCRNGGKLKKLIFVPFALLLGIPMLMASIAIISVAASGQYIEMPWNDGPIEVAVTDNRPIEQSNR